MSTIVVELNNVSKIYTLNHEKPTLTENVLTLKKKEEFWALKNINLTIKKGERLGIIGPNGSGKTTLLEIIAGITTPTQGSVQTVGKIISLIDVEAGFHPELSGEENIYLNGMLVGMSREEIKNKLKKIVEFAGIKQFIDTPFYTYSEGMKLRLGFSVVAHTNPDTILLDESLAVGDQEFREKSYNKIQEFFKKGKTIIVVSHFMDFIRKSCSRVVWLQEGLVKMEGNSRKIVKIYDRSVTNFRLLK